MKVICTQENLKAGLLTAGRVISNSSTLPILNNVLLKTENGLLKVLSTNLEIAIITHTRCKVEEEGVVAVNSKTITDLVNNLPNKNITLQTQDGQVAVETENYHTFVKTLPAEEFPLIPEVEGVETFTINGKELKTAIDQVVFAASKNQTQPEISGVLMALSEQDFRLVATDRYRLAEKKMALQKKVSNTKEVIVPQRTMAELSRLIGGSDGEVKISLNDTQIAIFFGDTQIISRLVDGQYPDYKQIIPTEFLTEVVVNRSDLISALRTGGIFSQNTNSVSFGYAQDKQLLTLVSESADLGKSTVELPVKISGNDGVVVLNYHYILDSLLSIDSEKVKLKIINDSSPSIILPEGKDDYVYLVMPIKS